MNITALVPYYGGQSTAAPSSAGNRPGYLLQTLASLTGFATQVFAGLAAHDTNVPEGSYTPVYLDCEPKFLPATLMRWAQKQAPGDLFYATEADQVLHYDPAVIKAVTGDIYLVPHRLEQLGPAGQGAHRGDVVTYDGRHWVFANGSPEGEGYYHPRGSPANFGGGFLATRELFTNTTFIDSDDSPVEHATGHCMSWVGYPQKTSSWQQFWVEHLSGYEHHCKL